MDCGDCCRKYKKQEYQVSQQEAKNLYVNSKKLLNSSSIVSSNKRLRDQKMSLKRSGYNSNMSRVSYQNQVPAFIINDQVKYINNQTRKIIEPPQFFYIKPNQDRFCKFPQNQKKLQLYQNNIKSNKPNTLLSQLSTQSPIINIQRNSNSYIIQKKIPLPLPINRYSLPKQKLISYNSLVNPLQKYQNHYVKINEVNNINKEIKNIAVLEQIVEEEFQNDLQKILNEHKEENTIQAKVNQKDYQTTANLRPQHLLKPQQNLSLVNSRISKTISGVRNIDDILCTKTQSVKDSQSSSSEMSQIISHPIPNLNHRITNSSINFVGYSDRNMPELASQTRIENKKNQYRKASFNN